jgi:hypothetical protein
MGQRIGGPAFLRAVFTQSIVPDMRYDWQQSPMSQYIANKCGVARRGASEYGGPMTCGIYAIENTASKFRYIGQSKRIEERWVEHNNLLARGAHPHQKLQQAWNEDGAKRFRYRILEVLPLDSANRIMHAHERVWMHKHGSRLYNEKGIQPERKTKKPNGPPAALWPYAPPVPFIPRRHHLGPPEGMEERRTVMYSGRRDHIRLAEIKAEKERTRSLKP